MRLQSLVRKVNVVNKCVIEAAIIAIAKKLGRLRSAIEFKYFEGLSQTSDASDYFYD